MFFFVKILSISHSICKINVVLIELPPLGLAIRPTSIRVDWIRGCDIWTTNDLFFFIIFFWVVAPRHNWCTSDCSAGVPRSIVSNMEQAEVSGRLNHGDTRSHRLRFHCKADPVRIRFVWFILCFGFVLCGPPAHRRRFPWAATLIAAEADFPYCEDSSEQTTKEPKRLCAQICEAGHVVRL